MKVNIAITYLPQPPQGVSFSLSKVDTVVIPHPYCITPCHVAWASDHYGGMLTTDAIRDAEKHGAQCDICKRRGMHLTVDQHESRLSVFIKVPQNADLNAVPGLHSYLYNNKPAFEKFGIQGFAFPVE